MYNIIFKHCEILIKAKRLVISQRNESNMFNMARLILFRTQFSAHALFIYKYIFLRSV